MTSKCPKHINRQDKSFSTFLFRRQGFSFLPFNSSANCSNCCTVSMYVHAISSNDLKAYQKYQHKVSLHDKLNSGRTNQTLYAKWFSKVLIACIQQELSSSRVLPCIGMGIRHCRFGTHLCLFTRLHPDLILKFVVCFSERMLLRRYLTITQLLRSLQKKYFLFIFTC